MMHKTWLTIALLSALPLVASAQDSDWSGSGEFGLAMARGNSSSDNANGKLAFANEGDQWKHSFYLSALRNTTEVSMDSDGDGVVEKVKQTSANRYEFGASSAIKLNEINSWVAALRYENDDFAAYEYQTTFSIGYGRSFINSERTTLSTQIGPGYRRAKDAVTGQTEADLIARGQLDFKHQLTASTMMFDLFLVEAGSSNTFASNEFGITVAINEKLGLKAGFDVRYNTDVGPLRKNTDTLTKVNLVYNFK